MASWFVAALPWLVVVLALNYFLIMGMYGRGEASACDAVEDSPSDTVGAPGNAQSLEQSSLRCGTRFVGAAECADSKQDEAENSAGEPSRGGTDLNDNQSIPDGLGPLSAVEKRMLAIILMTVVLWATEPFHHISAMAVGLAALVFMFVLKVIDVPAFKSGVNWTSLLFIGIALVLTGCMLYVSDKMTPGKKTERNMTVLDALIIGLCQCVAVVPGLSRSGTTITAGIATGLRRDFAVKFSFLMSLPAVLGANILSIVDAVQEGIEWSNVPAYLVGMAVALVAGIASINLLRYISSKGKFGGFAYYCWVIGVLSIILTMIF